MKVFVASSASDAVKDKYKTLASSVSTVLAKRGLKLIFGGIDTGMMGKCFYTYKYEGGLVKGITDITGADILDNLEVDAREITPTTFDRTKKSFTSCDLVIILPGGIDTIAELFSIIDENKTFKKNVPIILFNYEDYYTPLLDFLLKCHKEGFMSNDDLKEFDIVTNINSLEKYINEIIKD